jgi:hypothetical protein
LTQVTTDKLLQVIGSLYVELLVATEQARTIAMQVAAENTPTREQTEAIPR